MFHSNYFNHQGEGTFKFNLLIQKAFDKLGESDKNIRSLHEEKFLSNVSPLSNVFHGKQCSILNKVGHHHQHSALPSIWAPFCKFYFSRYPYLGLCFLFSKSTFIKFRKIFRWYGVQGCTVLNYKMILNWHHPSF